MPATSFAIVATPAARGRTVTLFIRGFSSPPGAGGVALEIGGVAMRAASPDETFAAAVTATLSADSDVTPVKATLDLPRPEDGSAASFALDSIDVSLPDCTKGS
jgi:hypothetical protein